MSAINRVDSEAKAAGRLPLVVDPLTDVGARSTELPALDPPTEDDDFARDDAKALLGEVELNGVLKRKF